MGKVSVHQEDTLAAHQDRESESCIYQSHSSLRLYVSLRLGAGIFLLFSSVLPDTIYRESIFWKQAAHFRFMEWARTPAASIVCSERPRTGLESTRITAGEEAHDFKDHRQPRRSRGVPARLHCTVAERRMTAVNSQGSVKSALRNLL